MGVGNCVHFGELIQVSNSFKNTINNPSVFYYTPIRIAKIKILTLPDAGRDTEKLDHLPYDPTIRLLYLYSREMKMYVHAKNL